MDRPERSSTSRRMEPLAEATQSARRGAGGGCLRARRGAASAGFVIANISRNAVETRGDEWLTRHSRRRRFVNSYNPSHVHTVCLFYNTIIINHPSSVVRLRHLMSCVSRSDVGAENVPLSYLDMLATVVDLAPAGGMNRPARFASARALSRRSAS